MEDIVKPDYCDVKSIIPTDPEFMKGFGCAFSACDFKKCCKKYKKGKRCKKCPDR